MSSRTRSSESRPARPETDPTPEGADPVADRLSWAEVPALLKVAVLVAAVGAVLRAVGPVIGVVDAAPAYGSGPLLIALAILPALVAGGLLAAKRPITAAGVLIGGALLGIGLLFIDLQLVADALVVSRPELAVPTSLDPLAAGAGTWLLVAGHVLTIAAGAMVLLRAGAQPGSVIAAEFDESTEAEAAERKRLLGWGLAFGGLTALGLAMPPFASDNAFIITPDLMNGPTLVLAGGLISVIAIVLGIVLAGTARTPKLSRGVLLGVAIAVLAFLLPQQIAGYSVDWLHTDWRSYLATAGVAGLVAVALIRPKTKTAKQSAPVEYTAGRWHVIAGVLAILGGGAAILGRTSDLFVVEIPTDTPISQTDVLVLLSGVRPAEYANRLLLPAGLLLVVLGVLLLIRPVAALARPALSVAWVGIPFAGFLALDALFTATGTSSAIRSGAAAWWTVAAVLLAIGAAVCAMAAGAVERDDVDLTDRPSNIILMAPVAAAILFAIGAFGLPTMRAPEYVAPGIWSNFRLASWGLLIALIAVLIAAVLAARSRPSRAASLLLGSAALVAVRGLELPLTQERAEGITGGPGTWLSIACAAAFVISAFVALAVKPEPAKRR
ncbi:hypothetical protein JOF56_002962 [Kibdelosporangium banguiense]|uniref:Uncharacterized protein n=1 Tax=Kibdelosporangium banguiense TaxID=1365924 RepID=A0ABS4TDT4_9PSEU|nr:hypothetical protein [Kibdelosporangium banguiense]MBP2322577.1 hypothetical protein [Kibdelosporangium banguiense]